MNEDYLFEPTWWPWWAGTVPENLNGSFWQTNRSNVPYPGHYAGELTLHIGDFDTLSMVTFRGPYDMTGNALDSDPSTVAPRRDNDAYPGGSGYEEGIDTCYQWGMPTEWYQSIFESVVTSNVNNVYVDLDSIFSIPHDITDTTGPNDRHAWCRHYAGFWVCRGDPNRGATDTVYVVKPTRIDDDITWDTVAFDYPNAYDMWVPGPDPQTYPYSFCAGVVSTYSGDYCYVGWYDRVSPDESYSYIICIDAENNEFSDTVDMPDNTVGLFGDTNGDSLRVAVSGGPDVFLTPEDFGLGDSNNIDSESIDDASDMLSVSGGNDQHDPSIAINGSNPIQSGSVNLIVYGEPGDRYHISIFDVSGRMIWSESGELRYHTETVATPRNQVPSGIYYIQGMICDREYRKSICIIN